MEITMSRATLSLAVLIAVVCCADAMNYLAFPRMGRSGYLAFPRMGRSGGDFEPGCCGIGLKEQFVVGQDGKEELKSLCAGSECCEGLREIADERPNGVYYSMCIPDIPVFANGGGASLNKLKNVLRK